MNSRHLRDPIAKEGPDGRSTTVDPGAVDKRLLVIEEEYAGALKAAGRDGSTLTAVIRQAWDGTTCAS